MNPYQAIIKPLGLYCLLVSLLFIAGAICQPYPLASKILVKAFWGIVVVSTAVLTLYFVLILPQLLSGSHNPA